MKIQKILESMYNKIQHSSDVRSLNILLEGDPSSGKSYLCGEFARKKNIPFVSLSMPTLIVEQATGIPYRIGDDVKQSKPAWLTELGENGLLLLDEFNAADDDVQKIFLSLLSDRRINSHQLGSKVMIVAAQNEYRQANNYKISPAVFSRFAFYPVEFDYADWRANYLPGKLNNFALSVLDKMMQKGLRFSSGEEFVKENVTTTARSVERWLLNASHESIEFLIEDAYANLSPQGVVVAHEVLMSLKDNETVANEIFKTTESSDYFMGRSSRRKKDKKIYEI